MPNKAPEEPKPLSFATPNPWSALPREVYGGKGRGKKEGATTESPVDGQDQPKIYTIRDHTLEVLMHPDVLELHALRVLHTPHGDERQLHLKVRVRCGQEELVVDVLVDTGAQVSLVRRRSLPGPAPAVPLPPVTPADLLRINDCIPQFPGSKSKNIEKKILLQP